MGQILGQYDLTAAGTPTFTIALSVPLDDSAGTYPAGSGESRQEFRRLPGSAVRDVEAAIVQGATTAGVTEVSFDLDLNDFGLWDNQIDRIFLNVSQGYGVSEGWVLSRGIDVSNVRQWRLNR